ncbi:MAG TPA: hypothetical protein VMU83_00605 [Hanamia sp.]|nr:hypothetical protein [Hanamia sp.]
MADNKVSSFTEKANDLKDQASQKFNELKGKAGEVANDLKTKSNEVANNLKAKSGEVMDDLKSGKLKEEAEEKVKDLSDSAKGLWHKITGK